ncbi:OLC1v1007055C1 [Oldenlandia corymbosa var. corymbosa]|uniref:OLC1v1007055C1 n=1 Tax=Oldenlandia corymbosa var. corymbosa TaxID=529605 RepID=A0AAV1DIV4_OLDCO|nr:OLC1v1007055C1 [Oldenlandia corymbosa var. corymbosa]
MGKKGLIPAYSPIQLQPNRELSSRVASTCLIGKIIRDYPLHGPEVKSFAEQLWKCKKDFSVFEIKQKQNTFVFCFQERQDWINVLLDSPWNIKGGLLILSIWSPGKIPDELDLSSSPFWVQIHGLPVDYLTEETALKIGKILGKFICLDSTGFDDGKFSWKNFLRIRVIIDTRRPLLTGHWISRTGLKDIWVDYRYEKLGLFCYKCGRIGNRYMNCKFPEGKAKFGPWLSVPPCSDATAALRSFAAGRSSGDGGREVGEKANSGTTLSSVPPEQTRKEIIYQEEEDIALKEYLPHQIYHAADKVSRRHMNISLMWFKSILKSDIHLNIAYSYGFTRY